MTWFKNILGKEDSTESSSNPPEESKSADSPEAQKAKLFIEFVLMQAQNTLFALGQLPTPDGRVPQPNLDMGKVMLDQLQIVAERTQGNLTKGERKIIEDTLKQLNLAFAEASGGTPASMMPSRSPAMDIPDLDLEPEDSSKGTSSDRSEQSEEEKAPAEVDENEKRKFFKSYG